jgi:uracil-DNA glycosylase
MMVGQDYGDVAYLEANRGCEKLGNRTNSNLIQLLASIGITIRPPGDRSERSDIFFTNAILCLKDGGMQAEVQDEWFTECGQRFLRAQSELVQPKVVVGLGERAHNSVRQVFGLPYEPIRSAVLSPGMPLSIGALSIGVYHCGARIANMTRTLELQRQDWQRVASALHPPAV